MWYCNNTVQLHNTLWPSDAISWQKSGSTLSHVMACCLMAQSHYLNHYWFPIIEVVWHSPECSSNFTLSAQAATINGDFENHTITATSSRDPMSWGWVTHICIGKVIFIGSDNGLSPGRRQAIIWTNVGILLTGPLGTNFRDILIKIHTFSFKKMHLQMLSAKWHPFGVCLNVLMGYVWPCYLIKQKSHKKI